MTSKSNSNIPSDIHTSGTIHGDDSFYDTIESVAQEYENTSIEPHERAVQEDEWKTELARLEDEIQTLKSVLNTKLRSASELKHKLGVTPIVEFKEELKHGITTIKESEPYMKTGTALKSFGAFASRKMGDFRNSPLFKSVEDKVGGAYSTVKSHISVDEPIEGEAFEEALRSSSGTDTIVKNTDSKDTAVAGAN